MCAYETKHFFFDTGIYPLAFLAGGGNGHQCGVYPALAHADSGTAVGAERAAASGASAGNDGRYCTGALHFRGAGAFACDFDGLESETGKTLYPVIIASQTIPTTALAPLFILWFGYGIWSKVLVTILMTFFPIAITVFDGLKGTKREMEELLFTYGATKKDIFLKLKLPTALPHFFSAIKMSVPMSVIGAAIAEWLGAQKGLGYFSKRMMTQLDGAGVFAPVVLLSVVAMVAVGIITLIEKKIITWRKEL